MSQCFKFCQKSLIIDKNDFLFIHLCKRNFEQSEENEDASEASEAIEFFKASETFLSAFQTLCFFIFFIKVCL